MSAVSAHIQAITRLSHDKIFTEGMRGQGMDHRTAEKPGPFHGRHNSEPRSEADRAYLSNERHFRGPQVCGK